MQQIQSSSRFLTLTIVLMVSACAGAPQKTTTAPPNTTHLASTWLNTQAGASVATWGELFTTPGTAEVEVLLTGHASGDRRIVLSTDDPNLDKLGDPMEPSAVLAILVRHPTKGVFLIDAGLSQSFAMGDGNYTPALQAMLQTMGSKATQVSGQDATSQLKRKHLSPRAVFLTHLHADHTSGLRDMDCQIPAFFGAGEDNEIQLQMLGTHLDCREAIALDLAKAPSMAPFEHALDVFGDSSFWALSTPGHSPGHLSFLVHARSGPVLITGDAVAYRAQFDHKIRPAQGVYDAQVAFLSLQALVSFVRDFPTVRVIVGHEMPHQDAKVPHAAKRVF